MKREQVPEAQKTKKSWLLKLLAESVILQAMEDLLSNRNRNENIEFFQGNGFRLFANAAEMRPLEKNILLRLLTGSLTGQRYNNSRPQTILSEKVKNALSRGKRIKAA